jgi:hypothetical protein
MILCLAATSLVTVATSKYDPSKANSTLEPLQVKNYYVASNCPGAMPQDQITVSDGVITSPSNRLTTDFGMPLTPVNFGFYPQVSGPVRGYQLTCYHSTIPNTPQQTGPAQTMPAAESLDLYTCYESNRFFCQVSFEEASTF